MSTFDNKLINGKALQAAKNAIDRKADAGHTHDDRYYTESEVNTLLSGKISTSARGASGGVASLDSNGKVPAGQLPASTNTTYTISQDSKDGHKFTLSGSDGSSTTITIPDSDTTYTLSSLGIGNVKNLDQSKAIKSISRSGTTFTYTCLDNTTGTFTQQDNNTWTAMVGATSSANGTAGYVPAPPSSGYNTKYLRADGTWQVPPNDNTNTHRPIQVNGTQVLGDNVTALNLAAGSNVSLSASGGKVTIAATNTTYSAVTTSENGLMISTDKTKLDGMEIATLTEVKTALVIS